eukprot:474063-Pleurochrysis_carterae.AAC.1
MPQTAPTMGRAELDDEPDEPEEEEVLGEGVTVGGGGGGASKAVTWTGGDDARGGRDGGKGGPCVHQVSVRLSSSPVAELMLSGSPSPGYVAESPSRYSILNSNLTLSTRASSAGDQEPVPRRCAAIVQRPNGEIRMPSEP